MKSSDPKESSSARFGPLFKAFLDKGAPLTLPALGRSMRPWIPDDSKVDIQKSMGGEYRFGDIVLFQWDEMLKIHRIIDMRWENGKRLYLCKGDASSHADGFIPSEAIWGKVVCIRIGGRICDRIGGLNVNPDTFYLRPFMVLQAFISPYSAYYAPLVSFLKRMVMGPLRFLMKFMG